MDLHTTNAPSRSFGSSTRLLSTLLLGAALGALSGCAPGAETGAPSGAATTTTPAAAPTASTAAPVIGWPPPWIQSCPSTAAADYNAQPPMHPFTIDPLPLLGGAASMCA